MLAGAIGGLLVAWILALFGADVFVIDTVQQFTGIALTHNTYYGVFLIIGFILGVIRVATRD